MNLPELITKLLHLEKDLIEQGIDVNAVKVTYPIKEELPWDGFSTEYKVTDITELENIEIKLTSIYFS